MTNRQHPTTPPPELVNQWLKERLLLDPLPFAHHYLATRAAQWGADVELEACCEWLKLEGHEHEHAELREARRPKPPSLKEQALLQLDTLNADLAMHGRGCYLSQIRRALEALGDD